MANGTKAKTASNYELMLCEASACGVIITQDDIDILPKRDEKFLRIGGLNTGAITGGKTFVSKQSGFWNLHSNWQVSGGTGIRDAIVLEFPKLTDDVIINSGDTITLRQDQTVNSLVNNGTIINNGFQVV